MTEFESPVDWKNSFRLKAIPVVAKMARLAGFSWTRIGNVLGRETLLSQIRSLRKGVPVSVASEEPLTIVFATLMYGYTQFATFEALLAFALESRGHDVKFIVCDQSLPICEIKSAGKEQDWDRLCSKCYGFGGRFLDASGFSTKRLSDVIRDIEVKEDGRFKPIVNEALLKHLRVGKVDDVSEDIQKRKGMIRTSVSRSAALGEALLRMKPDRVVMTHGNYSTWGPMRSVLLDAEVPVITYDHGKRKDSWNINWRYESAWCDVEDVWEEVRDQKLSGEQEDRIDTYLQSRRTHSGDRLQYNLGPEQEVDELRQRFGIDRNKQTFVLFTNVLWDAASTDREIVFADPIDWVIRTIRWFADRPDKQLVVRIHPAEVVVGTNQPFASIIYETLSEVPANVFIIEPQEPVNSWSVMHLGSLGLVHTSTVGLELALEGIACAVVSRTHYRGKGFTVDVDSEKQYFQLLEDWTGDEVDSSALQTLARRYAYLIFERYQMPLPFVNEWSRGDVRSLKLDAAKDLLSDASMRTIVNAIEKHEKFLLPA